VDLAATCRDFGVLIANDLWPSVHTDSVVEKAHHRASAMMRCFVSQPRDARPLMRAFTVCVLDQYTRNSIVSHRHRIQNSILKRQRKFRCKSDFAR